MKRIRSFFRSLRDFWANDQQRKTLMWVIAAVGALVLVYGVVQIVQGQLDYQHRTDDLHKATAQIDAFEAQFPTGTDANGVIKPDLSSATQDQLLMLATIKRQERDATNNRIDAYNKRAIGIRIAGVGVIGLALAYLVSPTGKKPDAEPEADQPPPELPPE
jgi:hypothetical protein